MFTDAQYSGLNIRQALLAQVKDACVAGKVHWNQSEVVDRNIDIGGLPGSVRYIPTFAYRKATYDQELARSESSKRQCLLCQAADSGNNRMSLHATMAKADNRLADDVNEAFVIYLNNFPYLNGQILLASRKHQRDFTESQLKLLVGFMARTGFAGAAIQVEGSGASIPGHAHVSVFDEPLPIFSIQYELLEMNQETTVAAATQHPSVCYKVSAQSSEAGVQRVELMIRRLSQQGLSYNLYVDKWAHIYVIPRTNRRSKTMNTKVGLSLPAGLHNGYVEHSPTSDIDALKREIWLECKKVASTQLEKMLEETTVQGDPKILL